MKTLTIQEMKAAEAAAVKRGSSYLQLMEQAGTACTYSILERYPVLNRRVTILCGSGNNGGDGLVIARLLDQRGADVQLVFCKGLPKTEEARAMLAKLPVSVQRIMANENLLVAINAIDGSDLLIDCIFGTGFYGEPDELLCSIFDLANRLRVPRIAVDIPSGMNGDTGEHGEKYLMPTETLALGAYKPAHLPEKAGPLCGELYLLDIGIEKTIIDDLVPDLVEVDAAFCRALLPTRDPMSHKGTYGRVLLLAGSVGMGGAAMMATKAALRSGAGITVLAAPRSVIQPAFPQLMEAMTVPLLQTEQGSVSFGALPVLRAQLEKSTAAVIGCGLGQESETRMLIRELAENTRIPLLLDADGINALAGHTDVLKRRQAPTVLTPHPGELARLLGCTVAEIEQNRPKYARLAALETNAVVVLKGHHTLTSDQKGTLYRNHTGNAGMAKGGSGDVLAGIIGSLLAQRFAPEDAAVLGVYLHGLCGDLCAETMSQYAMLAGDLIEMLPKAFMMTEQRQSPTETIALPAVSQKVLDVISRM